jgi:hypothetical protein
MSFRATLQMGEVAQIGEPKEVRRGRWHIAAPQLSAWRNHHLERGFRMPA